MAGDVLYSIAFYAMAAVAVVSALMVVWHRQPVISAINLVLCLFAVAVAYVLLKAHFLAAIQILLYAGAILVLFLMIIMLINQGMAPIVQPKVKFSGAVGLAAIAGLIVISASIVTGYRTIHLPAQATPEELAAFLIKRGWHPSDLDVKAPALAEGKELTAKEEALVARDTLSLVGNPEVEAFIDWPDFFDYMTDLQIRDTAKALDESLEGLAEDQGIDGMRVPGDLMQYFKTETEAKQELVSFIEAAVRGRLRHIEQFGTTSAVGEILFKRYIIVFEVASMLLLAAIVGVMVLARREAH